MGSLESLLSQCPQLLCPPINLSSTHACAHTRSPSLSHTMQPATFVALLSVVAAVAFLSSLRKRFSYVGSLQDKLLQVITEIALLFIFQVTKNRIPLQRTKQGGGKGGDHSLLHTNTTFIPSQEYFYIKH